MSTNVIPLDTYTDWFEGIENIKDKQKIAVVLLLLQEHGSKLSRPYSAKLHGSDDLFELIVQSRGLPYRIFYAFDPVNNAVLLLGGCKKGQKENRWYRKMIAKSEQIWDDYLND